VKNTIVEMIKTLPLNRQWETVQDVIEILNADTMGEDMPQNFNLPDDDTCDRCKTDTIADYCEECPISREEKEKRIRIFRTLFKYPAKMWFTSDEVMNIIEHLAGIKL
jgi:hypothetical protein